MSPLIYCLELLYAEKVDVIRPIDDVISPSNAIFQKTKDFVVEPVIGDPELLLIELYSK